MATFVACRHCGASVAPRARICPKCGIGHPGRSLRRGLVLGAIILTAIAVVWLVGLRIAWSSRGASRAPLRPVMEWLYGPLPHPTEPE